MFFEFFFFLDTERANFLFYFILLFETCVFKILQSHMSSMQWACCMDVGKENREVAWAPVP